MSSSGSNTPSAVDDAIEILEGDWYRKGRLEVSDISRIAAKRNLEHEDLHAVLAGLRAKGISAADPDPVERSEDQSRPSKYLTREQEKSLTNEMRIGARLEAEAPSADSVKLIKEGRRARAKFVKSNLGLVHSIARNLRNTGLDYDDIAQEGMKGLLRAIDMFDPDLGYKFSTYATWWIRQAILRGIDDTSTAIRIPVHRLQSVRHFRRMRRRLHLELGYEPEMARIASALDWSREKTSFIADLAKFTMVGLDAPLSADSKATVADSLPDTRVRSPEQLAIDEALREAAEDAIDQLPNERMKDVVRRRMGIGTREQTLEEIGNIYGVTRERIRQIEARALRLLAHPSRSRRLRTFLGEVGR